MHAWRRGGARWGGGVGGAAFGACACATTVVTWHGQGSVQKSNGFLERHRCVCIGLPRPSLNHLGLRNNRQNVIKEQALTMADGAPQPSGSQGG
jgi:hypothetical protein